MLIKKANLLARNNSEEIPLHLAAVNGHLDVVKLMVASNVDIGMRSKYDSGTIHYATRAGHLEVVKFLHQTTPDVLKQLGAQSGTALHEAATYGWFEIVKWLVENDIALLPLRNDLGETALHRAAFQGHLGIVKYLIASGIDPSVTDRNSRTAYHVAELHAKWDIMTFLSQSSRVTIPVTPAEELQRGRKVVALAMMETRDKGDMLEPPSTRRIEFS
jgi:ankyrin repeat protein